MTACTNYSFTNTAKTAAASAAESFRENSILILTEGAIILASVIIIRIISLVAGIIKIPI